MNKFLLSICFLLTIFNYDVFAQSYTKDSLQFKVYTIATFKDSNLKAIELDKIFCTYCSEAQLTALGQLGLKTSKHLIKEPQNRLISGKKRFVIYLRVQREKFKSIKENDSIN